jgi:hypothetical protein
MKTNVYIQPLLFKHPWRLSAQSRAPISRLQANHYDSDWHQDTAEHSHPSLAPAASTPEFAAFIRPVDLHPASRWSSASKITYTDPAPATLRHLLRRYFTSRVVHLESVLPWHFRFSCADDEGGQVGSPRRYKPCYYQGLWLSRALGRLPAIPRMDRQVCRTRSTGS